jgi:hypothetical protein
MISFVPVKNVVFERFLIRESIREEFGVDAINKKN